MAKNNTASPKDGRKLTTGSLAIIITAAILVVTLLTTGIVFLVNAIRKDQWFDYVKSDMSKYIDLPKEVYMDYELELSIAKPHAIDIDVALLNLISSEEFRKVKGDGGAYTNIVIDAGDKLVIRYRGYTLENGEEKVISTAMSNITSSDGTSLQIGDGSDSLPIGFELGLMGKNPSDYAKFEKILSGKAADHEHGDKWIVYFSAERIPTASIGTDNEKKDTVKLSNMRIDLADVEDVNKHFGTGFVETIKSYNVGQEYQAEFEIGEKNTKHTYKNFKIEFATTCEKAETSANGKAPLTVEGYFAYDFGIEGTATAGLRNQTVYYDVWVESVTPYDTVINNIAVNNLSELTDEVILFLVNKSTSDITEQALRELEGDGLVAKYRTYVKNYLDNAYDDALKIMIENKMWDRLLKETTVKKYPKIKVDEIYQEYEEDVYYQYDYNGGSLQDSEGNYKSYDTVDKFACAYLSLEEGSDWKATLYTMSENLVKERLILYYIMQENDMLPSEDTLNNKVEQIKQEYLDEYLRQYLDYKESNDEDFDREELKGEEYEKFVEERSKELFSYYDDDYFEETAYYELALDVLVTYPKVYTLDNPKPPVDK